jgi:hypothetical protein
MPPGPEGKLEGASAPLKENQEARAQGDAERFEQARRIVWSGRIDDAIRSIHKFDDPAYRGQLWGELVRASPSINLEPVIEHVRQSFLELPQEQQSEALSNLAKGEILTYPVPAAAARTIAMVPDPKARFDLWISLYQQTLHSNFGMPKHLVERIRQTKGEITSPLQLDEAHRELVKLGLESEQDLDQREIESIQDPHIRALALLQLANQAHGRTRPNDHHSPCVERYLKQAREVIDGVSNPDQKEVLLKRLRDLRRGFERA